MAEKMYRIPNGKKAGQVAKSLANEHGLYYGWTVFGGDWFVGTVEKLSGIGVGVPMPPTTNHPLVRRTEP